ncbi:molybdopterin-dependent oxidoreductase [Nocardioides jiangxiensis]|uniref:Molybdopterin-dependent oxidoreductase n=1 Tax=Nocardioides jiangxiensis TaxID=3064524 RepID=A0ABT9B0E1_9ACTN|nr:molybdopterin-dependent oxidoreductase [Nocardioides sp. WY-20]MDO7867779.1 molybdopterin-dependent oxidoreductase [Nocardioides sp. WY-20]
MSRVRLSWGTAGLVAGLAGLGVSYGAAQYLGRRLSPFDAVAELVISLTPGPVSHWFIQRVGTWDRTILGIVIAVVALLALLAAGRLAERSWWAPLPVYAVLGGIAATAALTREDSRIDDALPVALGVVTWVLALSWLTEPMHEERAVLRGPEPSEGPSRAALADASRRTVLIRAGVIAVIGVGTAVVGPVVGHGRRRVEQARRLLNLPVTRPVVPKRVGLRVPGVTRWQTPNSDFYLIDTAFTKPAIDPDTWRLRIHGMVEREVVLTYQDLLDREVTEDWITLNCVSNPVGGDLIGNAWWSGVRIAPLLAEAGVKPGADAVLQTSEDGWTCGTPLEALTDDRQAMIAFAMNGEPLPIEHGFPARVIVPGLYGYVSACKWVVDIEVTRFDRISAYWVGLGWAEQAPLQMSSRIDVPRDGAEVPKGPVRIGGVAWAQHTGIARVEYAVDGGPWVPAETGGAAVRPDGTPNRDTWVQWAATAELSEGDHVVRVRAVGVDGTVQTGVERDVAPAGATGWHTRRFTVG